MKKTIIIDGNSLANRAFYALPYLTDTKGNPSGAVFGFVNILIKLITEEKPDGIIAAFDHAKKTFRNELFKDYKATRKETPIELREQFPVIKNLLKEMGILVIEQEGIEADDIIGTVVKSLKGSKIILSGDRDLLQLISQDTQVWLTIKGVSQVSKIGLKELKDNYGILPEQLTDLKGLMGDSSDNIPGVSGIGEKTAHKLIEEYYNLDGIYSNLNSIPGKLNEKLFIGKEMAYLSKKLATIKTDAQLNVDFNNNSYIFPFNKNIKKSFELFGFNSLLKKNDLFSDLNIVQEKIRIQLNSKNDIFELIKKIETQIAFDLENMEFSIKSGEIYFLNPTIDMFSDFISLNEVIDILKPIFENCNILKIIKSSKNVLHFLDKLNIQLNNFFDIGLANYLIHVGESVIDLSNSCDDFFVLKTSLEKELKSLDLDYLYFNLELPLSRVLFEMEKTGFKIDEKALNELNSVFSSKILDLQNDIIDLAGEEFNINSPKQVASILFDKLGLKSYNNKKRSTSIDILNDIKWQHPIIEKIISYRKYQKLKSTYIDVYLKIISSTGDIIHTNFNQTLTNTGRISSTDPNLQNIPANDEEGKVLRKIFISKFDNGKIYSADYNQIELRLLADMSGEEKLIEIFKNNQDVHVMTACQIFNVLPEQVTQKMRREAKAVNFGIIYGISDYGLSQNIRVARKEAKNYIDSYFENFPKVKEFSEKNIAFAKEYGFIKTKFGRIRHIPEIKSSNFNIKSFGERVAMNMPLQGTASDIIKFSMLNVSNQLKKMKLKSQLILQIHDELVLDVFPGEENLIENLLHDTMEKWINLNVPLPISIKFGENLFDCK